MDTAIGSQDPVLVWRKFISFKIGHAAPGFFYYKITGGAIPCFQFVLIKSVESPGGNPAEVNGCRPEATDRNSFSDKTLKNFEGPIWHIEISVGKTGDQASFYRFCFSAYPYCFIIQRSAHALFCHKQLIKMGVVDGSKYHLAFMFQCNRHTIKGNAMGKIYCTVNW